MAKNSSKSRPRKKPAPAHKIRPRPVLGILTLVAALLVLIAQLDFHPDQVASNRTDEIDQNLVGQVGAYVGEYGNLLVGAASWMFAPLLAWLSLMFFLKQSHNLNLTKLAATVVILVSLSTLAAVVEVTFIDPPNVVAELDEGAIDVRQWASNKLPMGLGGTVGSHLYRGLFHDFLSFAGSTIIFTALLIAGGFMLLGDNFASGFVDFRAILEKRKQAAAERRAERERKAAEKKAAREEEKRRKAEEKAEKKKNRGKPAKEKAERPAGAATDGSESPLLTAKRERLPTRPPVSAPVKGAARKKTDDEAREPMPPPVVAGESLLGEPEPADESAAFSLDDVARLRGGKGGGASSGPALSGGSKTESGSTGGAGGGLKIIQSEATRKATSRRPEKVGDYTFPNLGLLREADAPGGGDSSEDHQQTAETLVRVLAEFGVEVKMGEVHAGPVITRYDVYPAPGVRVEKILNLDKNIALGLKATSVRILAPVPGKGCVGVEVPNRHPQSVCLREILESQNWVDNKAEIPVALGREVSGRPLLADLTKMPHLLIAGSTGSGKTVCINAIIASLLYHSSPDDLRFVMVDPKIVEMQVFNDLPHMLVPVVTDPKKVPAALKYLLKEMERRYQIFAKVGVRNIAGFNAKRRKDKESEEQAKEMDAALSPEERAAVSSIEVTRDDEIEIPEKLPYIVCVIDELADLMMVAPADIETCVARLAQLARAAGIHLIIATQRPSVNVITGVIKANLPSRIAFKVASKVDSRTILDGNGADHLIGRGDMLFLPPGSADFVRAQGAFVADEEITGIVEFLQKNGPPDIDEAFQRTVETGESEDEGDGSAQGDWDDELVPDAIEVLRTTKRASTSMLQRRLKIGYNRAARIMEILEDEDIVGPENGSSPREILKDLDVL